MRVLTFFNARRTVQNNGAPGPMKPRGANPVSCARRPQNHRQSLRFPTIQVNYHRRPACRVTAGAGGKSYCGMALRHDKAGEGSGRGRKATGHTRLRLRCVLKAKPSCCMGWLGSPTNPDRPFKPLVLTLKDLSTGFDFEKCRQAFSGRLFGGTGT